MVSSKANYLCLYTANVHSYYSPYTIAWEATNNQYIFIYIFIRHKDLINDLKECLHKYSQALFPLMIYQTISGSHVSTTWLQFTDCCYDHKIYLRFRSSSLFISCILKTLSWPSQGGYSMKANAEERQLCPKFMTQYYQVYYIYALTVNTC